jgi:hypothetical protein
MQPRPYVSTLARKNLLKMFRQLHNVKLNGDNYHRFKFANRKLKKVETFFSGNSKLEFFVV